MESHCFYKRRCGLFELPKYIHMKKPILFLLITLLSINCYSQIQFEKGYYINNSNQKIEGLIKNIGWKNNPSQFKYKPSENGEPTIVNIESVKEFGIYNTSKYIRYNVNIDRSTRDIDDLSHVKEPIFKKEELFLKVMVEGKASLYSFQDGNLIRYFFNKDNAAVEQLIFKKFETNNKIGVNNGFKRQLWNNLKCKDISLKNVNNLGYSRKKLLNFFVKYNKCSASEFTTFERNENVFSLTLRPGIKSTSLSINNRTSNTLDIDFENELGPRLGIEIELIMPFNKNKWAFILEPTYQYYKSEKTKTVNPFNYAVPQNITSNIDYESFELPIGIRHYFFLNKNSKVFVNGSVVVDFAGDKSNINFATTSLVQDPKVLNIETGINLAFGLGFKHNNKYSLELRYFTNRDLFLNYKFWESRYNSFSVIFGYPLFRNAP